MSLEYEVKEYAATVSTTSYSMSVGELVAMYLDNEINLHPEFQRMFRWTPEQKSKLIESLLLNIPIPPIFVSEDENSKWDVIDGLQRISTILEVMGELVIDEIGTKKEQFKLTKTKYLKHLDEKLWTSEGENQLPQFARLKIKRARIDVNIIRNVSDEIAKYEIFQRLNTGGSSATHQEVRNCIMLMNNKEFFAEMKRFSEQDFFKSTIALSERQLEESFDLELVTRFFVFSTCDIDDLSSIAELNTFLTDKLIELSGDHHGEVQRLFVAAEKVFRYLSDSLGEDSFKKFNIEKNRYLGGSLISIFEIVATGLGHKILQGEDFPNSEMFIEKHKTVLTEEISKYVKSGVRASTRLPQTIQYGRDWLR